MILNEPDKVRSGRVDGIESLVQQFNSFGAGLDIGAKIHRHLVRAEIDDGGAFCGFIAADAVDERPSHGLNHVGEEVLAGVPCDVVPLIVSHRVAKESGVHQHGGNDGMSVSLSGEQGPGDFAQFMHELLDFGGSHDGGVVGFGR